MPRWACGFESRPRYHLGGRNSKNLEHERKGNMREKTSADSKTVTPETEMAEAILKLVQERETVTFAELCSIIPGFDGEHTFVSDQDPNVILWPGISDEASEAMQRLRSENRIFMHPASTITYIVDGAVPGLPVAKRPPAQGYKKPHWLPVCFCTYPRAAQ